MDFTASWHWPQWVAAIWMIFALLDAARLHGDEKRVLVGQHKGEVEKYSFNIALIRALLVLFVLVPGGFFA